LVGGFWGYVVCLYCWFRVVVSLLVIVVVWVSFVVGVFVGLWCVCWCVFELLLFALGWCLLVLW
jgi:hypothetical protein